MSSQGQFVWYELMTPDPPAARGFYEGVIGWTSEDVGGGAYWTFNTDEGGVAGLVALAGDSMVTSPAWAGYVAVDDVDDYAGRFTAAGGTVIRPPAEIPGIGRSAMVTDPQGAALVLFKAIRADGPPAHDAPGYPAWRELMAADGGKAMAFYERMFGWKNSANFDMGPMGTYHLFAYDGDDRGGMMTKPEFIDHPYWGFYFRVEAIGAAAERIKAGGGQITNGPHQVPTGDWIVQAQDDQGAHFALISPTP
ncbi:MAG TPA: VOC family protein [Caulobacteraceae bacterium]